MGQHESANDPVSERYNPDELFTLYNQNKTLFTIRVKRTGEKVWEGTSMAAGEAWLKRHLIIPLHLRPRNKLVKSVEDAFKRRP